MSSVPEKKSYKDSLNLPQTTFPIRANAAQKDLEILASWETGNIYDKAIDHNKGNKKFVLHWGPPYSNGHLHMGHALNAVLKDIVCKFKRMTGFHVDLTYGWDCHGLPIELKVAAEQGIDTSKGSANVVALKKACRAYAANWMEIQHKEFREIGILADASKRYATMDPEYEADIVRAFGILVEKGYIERKGKTVPWCASCQTVLASAEIEHKDRRDPSIYVRFVVETPTDALAAAMKNANLKEAAFAVWTTTPWTLPLNEAVILHPDASYSLVSVGDQGYLMGTDLVDALVQKFEFQSAVTVATFHSTELLGTRVKNPVVPAYTVPVVLDEGVSLRDGTACLHCAPGCGPEDYVMGIKNKLPITSPLANDGTYTAEVRLAELSGKKVSEVHGRVITLLLELGTLIKKETIAHSYPHCWRCRNGLMFRATDQWFCNLEKNELAAKTIAATSSIEFIPDWGRNRFTGSVGTRTEWCISRQRHWGVPITALVCKGCSAGFVTKEFVDTIAQGVAQEGTEYWDRVTMADLYASKTVALDLSCDRCGGKEFEKETDTLDVWFDSGVSHFAFLAKRGLLPADMYLEGSDQHRGWFQSSMLTSMILNDEPCMKTIVTHGYVVDGQGRKMSKSLGNGIEPQEVVKKYGTDVLRLWVAAADFQNDITISKDVLETLAEAYRKIRNTARFLLANLYDFTSETDTVAYEDLMVIDKYALSQLHKLLTEVTAAYEKHAFTSVFKLISNFCVNDLSGFYLDVIKDRLYSEKPTSHRRRSAQTVLKAILDVLTKLIAPVLSFTAEEIYAEYRKIGDPESIHFAAMPTLPAEYGAFFSNDAAAWEMLSDVRREVLKAIEKLREAGTVKVGTETKVTFFINSADATGKMFSEFLEKIIKKKGLPAVLCEWFLVSQVDRVWSQGGDLGETQVPWFSVKVESARGVKCPRCWKYEETSQPEGLCNRCASTL